MKNIGYFILKLFYPFFIFFVLKILQSDVAIDILFSDNKTDKMFDLSVYKLQSLSILKNIQKETFLDSPNHEDSL
jgi:hypothetical protein